MANLPEQDRARVHAQCMRAGLCPPHMDAVQFRAVVNVIDGGAADDGVGSAPEIVALVASALGVGQVAAAKRMLEAPGTFAVMSFGAFRTAVAALQSAAESAAGVPFHGTAQSPSTLEVAVGQERFWRVFCADVRRRLPAGDVDWLWAEED